MKNFNLSLTTKRAFDAEINKILSENPSRALYVNITDKQKKRSLSANSQTHVWYSQIANFYGDRSALDVKNYCKDVLGLPILLSSPQHADKIEFLLNKLDYYKHSYDSRMKLIQCLAVTSEFSNSEMKHFMDEMIFYFNDLGINIRFQDE